MDARHSEETRSSTLGVTGGDAPGTSGRPRPATSQAHATCRSTAHPSSSRPRPGLSGESSGLSAHLHVSYRSPRRFPVQNQVTGRDRKGAIDLRHGRGIRDFGVCAAICMASCLLSCCSTARSAETTQAPARPDAAGTAVRPTAAVALGCANNHPTTWMGCITSKDPGFANMKLSEIAIPGADDSGTFNLDAADFDKQSGSSCTSYIPLFSKVSALVKRWSEAQNIDFTRQLDDGVRYFDFRLAFTGNRQLGWRIVHTQFSNDPLTQDLSAIASWAKAHPTEVVIIDVQHLCYDNSPNSADDRALWSDFSVLAPVLFDPDARASLAASTLRDITEQRGGGHNVVLMLPSSVREPAVLSTVDHIDATFVTTPGAATAAGMPTPSMPEAYAWASTVSPASPAAYAAANHALEAFPTTYVPTLGSLQGSGLYQSQIIYSLSSSNVSVDASMFASFSGLIPASSGTVGESSGSQPWEIGLWSSSFDRNDVIAEWGHRMNVVVSDGVEYGDYVPAVVEQNAAT